MSAASRLLGIVLAGGESRRFGSPKALATFDGEPLWRRAARVLEAVGLPVLVLANDPAVADAVTRPVRADARSDRGPLAGIETGLLAARERDLDGVAVLACDLVLVDAQLVAGLVEGWPGVGVAAFEAPGPWGAEPVCAVWGVDLLPAVSAALDAGHGSPGALLETGPLTLLTPASVSPTADPERIFRSVNHPSDLAELEAEAHRNGGGSP